MIHAGSLGVMADERDGRTDMTADSRGSDPNEATLTAFWEGGSLTRSIPASGILVIGRSAGSDVRVDHTSVSRKHAILHLGPTLRIEDAGSANGTRVGGKPATSGLPMVVAPGEVIECGQVVIVIQGAGKEAAGPVSRPVSRVVPTVMMQQTLMPPGARANETAMQRVERLVRLVSAGHLHVLVTGETGVGKEIVALRIHSGSRRAKGPFVRVDAASLSEPLLEKELFGENETAGLLEQANGGTIFVDEIGDLPLGIQAKLLRVLERGQVQRVGSGSAHPVDARFIASSNRDIRVLVMEGAFREDLYFRLNGITIEVPPLRDRKEQIATIAAELLLKACADIGREPTTLSKEAISRLESYEWPGNVRELKNALDRAVLLSPGSAIAPETLPAGMNSGDADGARLRQDLAAFERQRIAEALDKCAGNQTKAAQLLGISRRTLVSRLGEYNLPRPRGGRGSEPPRKA